jgi:hypothetical protein
MAKQEQAKTTETKPEKKKFFEACGIDKNVVTIKFLLEKPTAENKSESGKTNVVGRAFGKLPYIMNGKQLKISANIMLPADTEKSETVSEVIF